MKKWTKQAGFTLVELIVVLVILAILASLLVPALTGYVDKAKQQAVVADARNAWTAAQAAMSECYALYPECFTKQPNAQNTGYINSCRYTATIDGKTLTGLGRVTSGTLRSLQNNANDTNEKGTSSRRIALQVLKYLASEGKNGTYLFYDGSGNGNYGKDDCSLAGYIGSEKTTSRSTFIQILHTNKGQLVAMNFAKDGYMVTIIPGKEISCERNGKYINATESRA